jgi:hypothetical protein
MQIPPLMDLVLMVLVYKKAAGFWRCASILFSVEDCPELLQNKRSRKANRFSF